MNVEQSRVEKLNTLKTFSDRVYQMIFSLKACCDYENKFLVEIINTLSKRDVENLLVDLLGQRLSDRVEVVADTFIKFIQYSIQFNRIDYFAHQLEISWFRHTFNENEFDGILEILNPDFYTNQQTQNRQTEQRNQDENSQVLPQDEPYWD
jgi:hypothetical protein